MNKKILSFLLIATFLITTFIVPITSLADDSPRVEFKLTEEKVVEGADQIILTLTAYNIEFNLMNFIIGFDTSKVVAAHRINNSESDNYNAVHELIAKKFDTNPDTLDNEGWYTLQSSSVDNAVGKIEFAFYVDTKSRGILHGSNADGNIEAGPAGVDILKLHFRKKAELDNDTFRLLSSGEPGGNPLVANGVELGTNKGTLTDKSYVVFDLGIEGEPVEDTTPPVITLNGDATITLTQGDTFVDPGVTVTDNVDTDLEATVTYDPAGGVDTSVVGTYTIKYDAVDAAGNEAVQVIRTVIVQKAPTSETKLTVGSTEVEPGEEATVGVVLENADDLYGFNVKIAYDEAKYDNIEVVGIVDDTTASVTVDDGQIAVAKLSTSSAIADGTIFEIKFTLKDTVEVGSTTKLEVEEAMLAVDPGSDPNNNEAYKVDIENAVDGVITVKSSIVDKTALNALIEKAETLINTTETGDTPGKYGASEKAALETAKGAAETVMADPNAVQADIDAQVTALEDAITAYKDSKIPGYGVIVGDGDEPSSNDVKELLKYLVDASSLTETQKLSADVNDDGDVDILDALIIARYVAGVISKFPVE